MRALVLVTQASWRIPGARGLAWAHWDPEYSLFHAETGKTHLLNEFPAEILRRLSVGPRNTEELADALAKVCEVPSDAEWLRTVEQTLGQLEALDLIERLDA